MQYVSTRAQARKINFEEAVTCGLASDGGLYVPSEWPSITLKEFHDFKNLSYSELATRVLAKFAGSSVPLEYLQETVFKAYSDFDDPQVAPLVEVRDNLYTLELFHGPTLSFKDYALQFLGRFMDWSLQRKGERLVIVGATSGDTGSAAIHAVGGNATIDLFMLHPYGRVTDMQRRQMTTSTYGNIYNYAVDGTFDDCQAMTKTILNDSEILGKLSLGAVNSINWGRVAAQVVYYIFAALQLGAPEKNVSFAVPTGNFGNVFAAYVARELGLPIGKIVICTNENDILARFFASGIMQKKGVKVTLSPSMDIQVSSNFERFLFDLHNRDGDSVEQLMKKFARDGEYAVDAQMLERARGFFCAHSVDDSETCEAIGVQYRNHGKIVDPHTAVALASADKYRSSLDEPMVVVSTAHPAKFSEAIIRATGVDVELPPRLEKILHRPEKFHRISNNVDELKQLILDRCAT